MSFVSGATCASTGSIPLPSNCGNRSGKPDRADTSRNSPPPYEARSSAFRFCRSGVQAADAGRRGGTITQPWSCTRRATSRSSSVLPIFLAMSSARRMNSVIIIELTSVRYSAANGSMANGFSP